MLIVIDDHHCVPFAGVLNRLHHMVYPCPYQIEVNCELCTRNGKLIDLD
jgi:hypothetical protein